MSKMNRRLSPRMEVRLRCHVTSPPLWRRGAMYTDNISRRGVLIAWRGAEAPLPAPALGRPLSLEIELPADHDFAPRCIHCEGTVVRVTALESNCPRVALEVHSMDFQSLPDRMRASEALNPELSEQIA